MNCRPSGRSGLRQRSGETGPDPGAGGLCHRIRDIVDRLDQLLLMLVRFDQTRDRDSEKAATDELQRIMEQLHLYR